MSQASQAPKPQEGKKPLSYYFRVDFRTIQGRLTGGFLSMALISFLLINGANYHWRSMLDNRNYIIEVLQPVEFYSVEVSDKVNEAQVAFEKGLLFRSNTDQYLQEYEVIWAKEVKAYKDSLEKHINRLNDNNITALFYKLDNQLISLKKEYGQTKELYNNKSNLAGVADINAYLQTYLQSNILPLVTDLERTVQEIVLAINNSKADYQQSYRSLEQIRPWIVFLEFSFAVAVAAAIGSVLITSILRRIRRLKYNLKILAQGDLPEPLKESKDELNTLVLALNELSHNLNGIKEFATEVGTGKFDTELSVFDKQSELGSSLAEMKQSLKSVYEEERRRTWITEGLAKFSEIIRKNNDDLETLSHEIVANLVKYLEINQGGLFLVQDFGQERALVLKTMYAFNKRKAVEKRIQIGEGLLGQAFMEGGVVHIKKLPEEYSFINSGLGKAQPKELLIIPLVNNEETIGMLEMASFHEFPEYQINFLKSLAEGLASSIASVVSNEVTKKLLEESRHKTEAIQLQEEQLRQNTEELIATQEGLEKNLKKAEKEISQLKVIIDSIAYAVMVYDERGVIQLVDKDMEYIFGYDREEMLGRSINTLIDAEGEDMRSSTMTRTVIGEALVQKEKTIKGIRKDGLKIELTLQLKQIEIARERFFVATLKDNILSS